MSNKAIEKDRPGSGAANEPKAPHPLDQWLKRELQGLYAAGSGDGLPDDIAELAARLEERLKEAGDRGEAPAEEPEPGGDDNQG